MFPLNLPNALTLGRILLVPVLVVALTVESPGGSTIAATLVYLMVAATVVSGADYFLGFRRKLEEASRARERVGTTGAGPALGRLLRRRLRRARHEPLDELLAARPT